MKKLSKYTAKRRHPGGGTFNAANWQNVIQRNRAYTDEPVPGATVEGTIGAAEAADNRMSFALMRLLEHRKPDTAEACEETFDLLAHALGVATIRCLQIQPDTEKNEALPVLKAGTDALQRSIERYKASGAWGVDGPGRAPLADAIDLFSSILMQSSPAQMTKASDERERLLREMADALKSSETPKEPAK